MTRVDIAKKAVSFVVTYGVGVVITNIALANSDPNNVAQKVAARAAGFVVGSIVADACSSYTNSKIDEVVGIWNQAKNR